MNNSTPYPDVNLLLEALLKNVQAILGDNFLGMYLDGSLASGDFDTESDIDFVVVATENISGDQFVALQSMHDRLAGMDSPWAIQLEGFYVSQQAIKRYVPDVDPVPNIERGRGERLKLAPLDLGWEIHRYILRERGIILAGPAPHTLIEPVSPDQLQRAMFFNLTDWAALILQDPTQMESRGYQSFTVLSLCRILYTLQFGDVASKQAAARWAQDTLDERWSNLIDKAWDGRRNPDQGSSPDEVKETLEFIRFILTSIHCQKR
jgi:predicted nucleotidyltransferase